MGVTVLDTMPSSALGPATLRNCSCSNKQRGGLIERFDVGARQTVGQREPGEGQALDRIAARSTREAGAVLGVVLHELRIDADRLTERDGFLLGLVEIVFAVEDGEAGGDGAVEQIRLGETKHEAALEVTELRRER